MPNAAGQHSSSPLVRAGLPQNQVGYDGRMHHSVYSYRVRIYVLGDERRDGRDVGL